MLYEPLAGTTVGMFVRVMQKINVRIIVLAAPYVVFQTAATLTVLVYHPSYIHIFFCTDGRLLIDGILRSHSVLKMSELMERELEYTCT